MSTKIRAWAMGEVFADRPYKRNDWTRLQRGDLEGFYACEDYEHMTDSQLIAEVNKQCERRLLLSQKMKGESQ